MPLIPPPELPDPDADAIAAPDEVDGSTYVHVYPMFDGREHICIGFTCWCKPQVDVKEPLVIIHNLAIH